MYRIATSSCVDKRMDEGLEIEGTHFMYRIASSSCVDERMEEELEILLNPLYVFQDSWQH
jgi:hypothetical protein